MTCIVGLVDTDGSVYMGADSAGAAGWDLTLTADPKVRRNGPFLLGYTTSFRMGQRLHYALVPPVPPPAPEALYGYMVTTFVDAVRECLKAGGYASTENSAERGGTFLVAGPGRLFTVTDEYAVLENTLGYAACGCGQAYALGVLYATQGLPGWERVRQALGAAEALSAGVRGPFTILHLPPEPTSKGAPNGE